MIGKILGGRYEIIEKIGEGGMARVYKAHCNKLDRFVAIKILKEEFSEDEEFIRKFRQEARSAAHLTDPNIVNVYDVGESEVDGEIVNYIVMELLEGETLKNKIKDGSITIDKAIKYSIEIAKALKVAHKSNIIHRDIKPHNILIDKEDRVKVADFGIARAITNFTITTTSNVLGSVHYFSPEQARGGYTDEKSDLYSLGVVMYEMATGRLPYEGETPIAVAMKHIEEEPQDPREINPLISEDFANIILRAIKKRQIERYQSASELIHDLEGLERGEKVEIKDYSNEDTQILPRMDIEEEEKEQLLKPMRKKESTFKRALPIFAGILMAMLFFGVFLAVRESMQGIFSDEPDVVVPKVSGKKVEDVEQILKDMGLNYEIKEVERDETPGTIVDIEPKEGTEIKKSFPLTLTVSKARSSNKMPDVRDLKVEEANRLLEEVGIFLSPNDISYEISETIPKDSVIEQYPSPNSEITEDTKAKITLSRGKKGDTIIVPYVIGMSEEEGRQKLEEELIKDIVVKKENNTIYEKGTIYYQSVPAGDIVDDKVEIEIYVSLGGETQKEPPQEEPKEEPKEDPTPEEDLTQTKSITLSPKVGQEATSIQIIKIYEGISEVVYTKELAEGDEPVRVNLTGKIGTSFDIIFDGTYESTVSIP